MRRPPSARGDGVSVLQCGLCGIAARHAVPEQAIISVIMGQLNIFEQLLS
jgi:hypothetical protein